MGLRPKPQRMRFAWVATLPYINPHQASFWDDFYCGLIYNSLQQNHQQPIPPKHQKSGNNSGGGDICDLFWDGIGKK